MASQFLKLPNQRSERRHSTPVFYTSNPSPINPNGVNGSNQHQGNHQQNHHHQQQRYSRSSDDSEIPLLSGSPTFLNGLFPFLDRHKHHQHQTTNSNKSSSSNEKSSPTFAHRILKMKPKLTSHSPQHQHHSTERAMASGSSSAGGGGAHSSGNVGYDKANKKKRGGSFKRRPLKHTDS